MLTLLLTLILHLSPIAPVPAQSDAEPPMLMVTVRNSRGVGLAGVLVLVHDYSGSTLFAQVHTDANGVAAFPALPVADLRIALSGVAPTGHVFVMPGADTQGIAFVLGSPPNQLDLLVEPDGRVLPDPASMLALEIGVPIDANAIPTAPLAATPIPHTATPTLPDSISAPPAALDNAPPNVWPGIAAALVLLAAVIGLVVVRRRMANG